jgi:putative peptidoglycan lipid II flippase
MAFVAAVGLVTRTQVVDLLFGWGFDQAALDATAAALGIFLLGLPAHALNVILARAFYSGKDTVTPVTVSIVSVGVNVTISILAVGALGIAGLALGIALGAWFEATTLTILLRRRHPALAVVSVVDGALRSLAGAVLAAASAWVVLTLDLVPAGLGRVLGLLLELSLASAAGLAVYLLYSRLVRLPELPRTVDLFRSALRGR